MKHILKLFALAALCAALTFAAAAETGSCGDNTTYTFDTATGVMIISGTGDARSPQDYTYREDVVEIIFEEGVTSIGYYGFSGYESLERVTIPASLTHVGEGAFARCTKLASVQITSLEKWSEIWFDSATANPLYYAHLLYLDGAELTTLDLPAGTRQIGAYAFCGGTAFTAVTIPASVRKVGSGAFGGCTSLAAITVDRENENYIEEGGVLLTADRAKLICAAPGALGSTYTLPDTVESIGAGAFYGCRALTEITLPDGIRFIGEDAFAETGWYDAQEDGILMLGSCVIGYRGEMPRGTTLELDEGTTCIADLAFNGQYNMTAVHIPAGVTNIGYCAFNFTGVKTVYIDDLDAWCSIYIGNETHFAPAWRAEGVNLYLDGKRVRKLTIPEGTTEIRDFTFANIKGLTDVALPDSVTAVAGMAFCGSGLYEYPYRGVVYADHWAIGFPEDGDAPTALTLDSDTVGIAESAFSYALEMQSVTLPANLQYIGEQAFCMTGLRTVTFAEGCKLATISRHAFSNNASLKEVDLPDTVEEVEEGAFGYCEALTRVTFRNRDCTIADAANTVSEQAEICGWRGSTAEAYAEKYGRTFAALDTPTRPVTGGDADETPEPIEPMTLVEALETLAGMLADDHTPATADVERLLAAVR